MSQSETYKYTKRQHLWFAVTRQSDNTTIGDVRFQNGKWYAVPVGLTPNNSLVVLTLGEATKEKATVLLDAFARVRDTTYFVGEQVRFISLAGVISCLFVRRDGDYIVLQGDTGEEVPIQVANVARALISGGTIPAFRQQPSPEEATDKPYVWIIVQRALGTQASIKTPEAFSSRKGALAHLNKAIAKHNPDTLGYSIEQAPASPLGTPLTATLRGDWPQADAWITLYCLGVSQDGEV